MSRTGKSRKKRILIALIVFLSLILVYSASNVFMYFSTYAAFFKIAQKDERIPSLLSGFVPQGVSTLENSKIICGYMDNKKASRIFVINEDETKEILLENEDGTPYTGHAGGVTAAGDFIYVSNAEKLFVLSAKDVLSAENESSVRFQASIPAFCRASFCSNDGKFVYVGEYHKDGYETLQSHKVQTSSGDFQAMVFAFKIDEESEFGLSPQPEFAFAVPDEVQGFAKNENLAVLSCSGGLSNSKIICFDTGENADASFDLDGKQIPLYILDSKREKSTIAAPRMSEDLEFFENDLFVGFESSSRKFGAGFLPFSTENIMKLKLYD